MQNMSNYIHSYVFDSSEFHHSKPIMICGICKVSNNMHNMHNMDPLNMYAKYALPTVTRRDFADAGPQWPEYPTNRV